MKSTTEHRPPEPKVWRSNRQWRATNTAEHTQRTSTEVVAEKRPWPGVATALRQSVAANDRDYTLADVERDLKPYSISALPPGVAHSDTDDHATAIEWRQGER